ncbi:MAG: transglutaminase-like cysteine peptidase [Bdellovibrionales bacterium]
MKLRITRKYVLGGAVLCAALLGCALYYWMPLRAPVSHDVVAVIPKPRQEIPKNEEIKEAVPEPPSEEEPPVEKPAPPPEIKEPEKPPVVEVPPEVLKEQEVPPPVLKKQEPAVKPPKPKPPPVVEEKEPPPVIIEKPAPPPVVEEEKPEPEPPPVVIEEPEPPPVQKPRSRYVRPTYFVNREVESDNIKMFPRWTGMLSRYSNDAHKLDNVCGSNPHPSSPCKLKEWKDTLESLREAPLVEKLREVNRYLNKYPYIDDIVNWGFDNYWETPYEFQRKSGNCKDYAIAKFMSLRAIGVPNDIMRLVVLKDLNLGGIIHAILVVSTDEKSYILDNQIKQLVTTDKVYHYVPIYSINEEHWWQHFVLE